MNGGRLIARARMGTGGKVPPPMKLVPRHDAYRHEFSDWIQYPHADAV